MGTRSHQERFRHSADVASRRIADEVLLVPIRRNPSQKFGVFTLNPTGSLIWDLLDGQHTVAELVDAVCERFAVGLEQARQDTRTFCADLLAIGAIEAVDGAGAGDE